ncbi:MAG: SMI1/KNR4 family protein [Treponema sp.]|nr:SMI1/KNR4 family protein [Treponema sp.]
MKKIDIIDEIIDILNEDNSSMIARPAGKDDISLCQKMLTDIGLEPLPQGYIDFLKKNNGLAWNGIIFYSTDQVSCIDDPNGFKIMDLVTTNDEFNDRFELDEKVLLGIADDDYYTYNIETRKYEVLEFSSRELMEEFDSFADLFRFTVGGRLGLFDGNGGKDE